MGMGGAIPVEYAHPGLAERAVIDHVVLQPHIVSVAAPVDGWVEQFLVARPCAGRVVGHMELHNGDDTCCARILAPAMCMHTRFARVDLGEGCEGYDGCAAGAEGLE
eukprot:scaffold144245_cov187-Phaeocystis_antarctica.AAC.1